MLMRERVTWARQRAQISARQLSRLAGLTSAHVSHIERGMMTPGTSVVTSLAEVLGCSLDWLVSGHGEPPTDERIAASVQAARERLATRTAETKGVA